MRVAFDGHALTAPAGGVRRYIGELCKAITVVAPDVEMIGVGADPRVALPPGVRATPAGASLWTNLGWSVTGLPLAAAAVDHDLFHAPAYTAPLWLARPLVLTIHDACYARRPEWYPYRRGPIRRAFYRSSACRADRILTDSTFSRDEIAAAYAIDHARIDVVPLGLSDMFAQDAAMAREPFVLHVGDLHERRNLSMLLDVVLDLRRAGSDQARLRLVLAGVDRGVLAGLQRQASAAPDALDFVENPSDAAVVSLYRRAAVLAYPSRYEGFGLPVLEAMGCATPVVASNAGALPELVGDAAPLLPPDDSRAWRETLAAVLTDCAFAAELSARGAARAKAFTWERTARGTLACYRRALQNRNGNARASDRE